MFKSRVVFVVGAGASAEFGLPVGHALKRQIAEKSAMLWGDGYRLTQGDRRIADALETQIKLDPVRYRDISPFVRAGWRITKSMPQAASIDYFLDTHQKDNEINLVGKLSLVACIAEGERASLARLNQDTHRNSDTETVLDFEKLEQTWAGQIQKMLFSGVGKSQISSIFNNISFVNFNYDRCIEHILKESVENYFNISESEASSVVLSCKILHAYGSIGDLPWHPSAQFPLPFGADITSSKLLHSSSRVKTFTESESEGETLSAIRDVVYHADIVVFLGLGFHPQNIDFMSSGISSRQKKKIYLGSAYGTSASDREIITSHVFEKLGHGNMILEPTSKCADLLREYARMITA